MPNPAQRLHGAEARYQGTLTRPDRWNTWQPNEGDIIVCTPAKCGTTWTQTIIEMLLYRTTQLPDRISALSPWIDSALEDADGIAELPASPSGRRLVKTHSPGDGFPIWKNVRLVAVYRHPLDVFLSIRKHVANMKEADDPVLCGPLPEALAYYLDIEFDADDIDRDSLEMLVFHYLRTINRKHLSDLILLHYGNMIADHRGTVKQLAVELNIDHDDALVDKVTAATEFAAMKAKAAQFAPEGGKSFWHKDSAFFDSGGTNKWQGILSDTEVARFETRLRVLIADAEARSWLTDGRM